MEIGTANNKSIKLYHLERIDGDRHSHMGVSENSGTCTPKSSILIGFSM